MYDIWQFKSVNLEFLHFTSLHNNFVKKGVSPLEKKIIAWILHAQICAYENKTRNTEFNFM